MSVIEAEAKSIVRKSKRIDSWFLHRYGMNLYRGCPHACAYCDGRDERYRVEGRFDKDLTVKVNAIDVLNRELDPKRKRKPFEGGYFLLGGGVSDSFQPLEMRYGLTHRALELLFTYDHPVHIITKNAAVLNELELLHKLNARKKVVVSFSFSTTDDALGMFFEPGTSGPDQRLEAMSRLSSLGIPCGMLLMPVIPFVTDHPDQIDHALGRARDVGARYVLLGAMTLKDGRQKEAFMQRLNCYDPDLELEYASIYGHDRWGSPSKAYQTHLNEVFAIVSKGHRIPRRIPPELFSHLLSMDETAFVMLQQMDYLTRLTQTFSPYGPASYAVAKLPGPLVGYRRRLTGIDGVGQGMARVLAEIIDRGSCKAYERMLMG